MSDSSPPPKPKPGSLRDRIAAFEQKPASSPTPPHAPRPKPGNLSQWKPRAPSPQDTQPASSRVDTSMSASDAKESITKGGSLKERMAALQGLGAFGGVPGAAAPAPAPKPAERPKWKPPPQVAVVAPVASHEDEDEDEDEDDGARTDSNRPALSSLRAPTDDILATLSTQAPAPAAVAVASLEHTQEGPSEVEGEAPAAGEEEVPDPEEEERQRRAAIAARMARLGGTRVGMTPPIFGRKPDVKPKPAVPVLASEATNKDVLTVADPAVAQVAPRSERDEVAENEPLPTSPHTYEVANGTLSAHPQVTSPEPVPPQPPVATSPNVPSRSMPVPQGPRRAAPPRKKKQTPPAETESATSSSLDKDTPTHDGSDTVPEGHTAPAPVPDHEESEVKVIDPTSEVSLSEPADELLESIEQSPTLTALPVSDPEAGPVPPRPVSPPVEVRPEHPDEPEIDTRPTQDLQSPDDAATPAALSIPPTSRISQEEVSKEVVVPEPGEDETPGLVAEDEAEDETTRRQRIAERVAKTGGLNPFGGQPPLPPTPGEEPPVEGRVSEEDVHVEGTAFDDHPATPSAPSVSYSVSHLGGGATAFDGEDDGNDESDLHTQASLRHGHGDGDEPSRERELGDEIDHDDAHARVSHAEQAAEFGQHSKNVRGESDESDVKAAVASSPTSATGDFGAAQRGNTEDEPLAPALPTANDVSDYDSEMAPPRVTRPLPPAPPASVDLAAALARVPPPPAIPKRMSLPPPARAVPVPVPALDSPPPSVQSASPYRVPPSKRTSLLPPTREIPIPSAETQDVATPRRQPSASTRKASLPPPSPPVPSPSVSREASLVPPPRPPPPPSLGLDYAEQEPWETGQTKEESQVQDEVIITPPPPVPTTRRPSLPPPTPEGRRSVESRRSTDLRTTYEERRASGQYATVAPPPIPRAISPPPKKRAPPPLLLEQEVLDEDIGDPIDPRFHTPKSPNTSTLPRSPPPSSGAESLSSVPAVPSPSENESSGNEETKRRKTIAERMAKLGGIKFGAPPPVTRPPPSAPAQPADDVATEETTTQAVPEEEEEEDEQARRQRITAKLAGMGGMRFGMLPIQPGVGLASPPPPPIPVRAEEESTPRSPPRAIPPPRQPAAHYTESDQEYEHPSSSDDGVQVEAEESELEEVRHEDLDDEYDVEDVAEPPPPPPRSTRPPVPSARPPLPPPGRKPSVEVPPPSAGRSGSFDTITSVPRPPVRQTTSDFVMVEAEEAQVASTTWSSRGPPPTLWSTTSPPQLEPSDLGTTGQWELPSIPSGSLDLGDSGVSSDLSGSMWSEDSTTYPLAPAAQPSAPPPLPPPPVGQPRAHASVPARMTADDLRVLWNRVGVHVAEAASGLLERSKRTLVGNGSYEGFIAEALTQVPNAAGPQRPGEYGFLIYAQTAAQVHTRLTDIMPGDVVVLEGARLKGHKGLHTYSISAGEGSPCMGVVHEFDAKKLKLKALQANQRVGQVTVESVSYRLEDLKSGTIKVYRVGET